MTPIVIPAYEPDERLLLLLETLKEGSQGPVVIVDDGSGHAYKEIFEQAGAYVEALGGVVLTHEVNRGKGRALKTAFACILKKYPEAIGCVTADSDGQHSGFKLGNLEIPPELLARLMQMDMSPENLQKLQKLLDFVFEVMPQSKEESE